MTDLTRWGSFRKQRMIPVSPGLQRRLDITGPKGVLYPAVHWFAEAFTALLMELVGSLRCAAMCGAACVGVGRMG